jgi:hypothetical protein
MRRLAILVGLFFAVSLPASAQKLPKFEIYGGYLYAHFKTSDNSSGTLEGWTVAPAYYPFKNIGAVLELGDSESPGYTQDSNNTKVVASSHSYHAYIGPRVRIKLGRMTPFADVLFGGIYRTQLTNSVGYFDSVTGDPVPAGTQLSGAQFDFAIRADGGVDFKLAQHIAWRAEGGFVHWDYTISNAAIADPKQDNVTFSTGIVIRWN